MSSIRSEVNRVIPYVASFGHTLTTDLTNEILSKSMRVLLDRLSESGWVAAGLFIADCIASGDLHSLCDYDPYILDLQPSDQVAIRQCLAFFGKRQDIDLGVDREAVATDKFWAAERACALTNASFRAWSQGRFQFRPEVEHVLHRAQLKISDLLGEAPRLSDVRPRFGPGATTQTPKKNACPVVKLRNTPACSANFSVESLEETLASTVMLCPEDADSVQVNIHPAKLAFVPKNAKTDRAICSEPALNGMFQNGLGELMAKALRRVGINIRDQSANQRAALYGSISGASATIDLSSASDTVSLLLVEHLLPPPWYDLVWNLRSAEMAFAGTTVHKTKALIRLEKVSSMGNGFTFPLETIIFWAISQSVVELYVPRSRIRTLVYGDDIIVPTAAAKPLIRVLMELGFTPNDQKSFYEGNFRESCGKDYVFGHDVRPIYVTDVLTGADLFRLHNFFFAAGDIILAELFKSCIDPECRTFGPSGFGDGHLHCHNWPARPVVKDGRGGFTFDTWTFKPKRLKSEIAKRIATPIEFVPKIWDPIRKDWQDGKAKCRAVEYHPRMTFLVRRLATYTQYLREGLPCTISPTDAALQAFDDRHVFRDRRMPDPRNPNSDDMFFVVPGEGPVVRTRVYTFESPSA